MDNVTGTEAKRFDDLPYDTYDMTHICLGKALQEPELQKVSEPGN